MKIKVCGMRQTENIRDLVSVEPNFMGFIFYDKSPRHAEGILDPDELDQIPEDVYLTGVFVEPDPDYVEETIAEYGLDAIQLHGNVSPEQADWYRELCVVVIKVFAVDADFDFTQVEAYRGKVDLVLFDTKGTKHGGNGVKFDWSVLSNYKLDIPFLLSGGIGPNDVEQIKALDHPKMIGLDLNSGFEHQPGLKDMYLLRNFIEEIRN